VIDHDSAPVVDNEQQLLRLERRYQERRTTIRRLREELAREEEEEDAIHREYASLLDREQATMLTRALADGNVDDFLSSRISERQRTTLPTTWREYNPYTQSM
jgi:predicted RNase H-like nuclease (RuvC/YqgF family)